MHTSETNIQTTPPMQSPATSTGVQSTPIHLHQGETTYTGAASTHRDHRFLASRSKRAMQFIATYTSKDTYT
jgi:hypothetical protein